MNEKERDKMILIRNSDYICTTVDCRPCILFDKEKKKCRLPSSISERRKVIDKEITATYKQTTPPHTGTSRVLDYVLADLKSRAEMGREKYGHYLETNNGRNALQDAYEEALDMCMYLKQRLLEEGGK